MADLLNLDLGDTSHLKRNIEIKLKSWGYKFNYIPRKGVEIISQPTSPQERLTEIMIREYGLDVQIDIKAFACFIYAFSDIEGFSAMPWKLRTEAINAAYGVNVCERTLRNWCDKLINTRTIEKSNGEKTYWRTSRINGETFRDLVSGNEELERKMRSYWVERNELLKEYNWNEAFGVLWNKYHCCYYSCKTFVLSAFDNIGQFQEIYELIEVIMAAAAAEGTTEQVCGCGLTALPREGLGYANPLPKVELKKDKIGGGLTALPIFDKRKNFLYNNIVSS